MRLVAGNPAQLVLEIIDNGVGTSGAPTAPARRTGHGLLQKHTHAVAQFIAPHLLFDREGLERGGRRSQLDLERRGPLERSERIAQQHAGDQRALGNLRQHDGAFCFDPHRGPGQAQPGVERRAAEAARDDLRRGERDRLGGGEVRGGHVEVLPAV